MSSTEKTLDRFDRVYSLLEEAVEVAAVEVAAVDAVAVAVAVVAAAVLGDALAVAEAAAVEAASALGDAAAVWDVRWAGGEDVPAAAVCRGEAATTAKGRTALRQFPVTAMPSRRQMNRRAVAATLLRNGCTPPPVRCGRG
jgi:cytochrome c5